MRWNVTEAKQKLSAVIRAAQRAPQLVFSRGRLVAAIVSPETLEEFQQLKDRPQGTLADAFARLRRLCDEEDYVLEIPSRQDRPSAFSASQDAGRHEPHE